jgi:hypothetical protein
MAQRAAFQIAVGATPKQGAVGIAINFDFTAVQVITSDLALEQQQGAIDFVQSIFIDNRLNAQPFVIVFSGLRYTIQCRAGRQGIFPVIAATGNLGFTATSTGGIIVPAIMMNTSAPAFVWDV